MGPDDFPSTSEDRYRDRLELFERDGKPNPKLRHTVFWVLHNCVAHPLLGLRPNRVTVDLHSLTSAWLNKKNIRSVPTPIIDDRKVWRIHNCVAHVLIGLAPCRETFAFHDASAEEMKVPGWV